MFPSYGTDRFVMVRRSVPAGPVNLANPILRQVELFGIDAGGMPVLVNTWLKMEV